MLGTPCGASASRQGAEHCRIVPRGLGDTMVQRVCALLVYRALLGTIRAAILIGSGAGYPTAARVFYSSCVPAEPLAYGEEKVSAGTDCWRAALIEVHQHLLGPGPTERGACRLVDFPPESRGVRSERHAAARMVIPSMLARASAGVR